MVQVLDKEGDANMLTLERAKEINAQMVTEEHLIRHSTNVMAAMGAMARHFGEDEEHWKAIGYLHDYDYEKYPEEHLHHTEEPLLEAGVDPEDVRALFDDLCTRKEIDNMAERVFAAKLLLQGNTYSQVMSQADISSATLSRVSRCVQYGSGYSKLLKEE